MIHCDVWCRPADAAFSVEVSWRNRVPSQTQIALTACEVQEEAVPEAIDGAETAEGNLEAGMQWGIVGDAFGYGFDVVTQFHRTWYL